MVCTSARIMAQQKNNITRSCSECGQPFTVVPSKAHERKYCSRICYKLATEKKNAEKIKANHIQPCSRCGVAGVVARGMCGPCYQHYQIWRQDRMLEKTCPICGKKFQTPRSRDRFFCSTDCYVQSDIFQQARKKYSEKMKACRIDMTCLYCGKKMRVTHSTKYGHRKMTNGRSVKCSRLFCGRLCYRKHFAERFDRWARTVAPIDMKGLSWDEFLAQESLPCIVDGCDWIGDNLSIHANHAHGITADELKELLGFNRRSGLISTVTWKKLSQLAIKLGKGRTDGVTWSETGKRKWNLRPEGREHIKRR